MKHYIKPRSVTFWAGVAQIVAGCLLALHDGYNLGGFGQTLISATGGIGAYPMIVSGLGLIGIRRAVDRA